MRPTCRCQVRHPPMFRTLVGVIHSMQSEVSVVEGEYSVDCSTLKKSMEDAVTQLEAYLLLESAHTTDVVESVDRTDVGGIHVSLSELLNELKMI